MRVRFETTPCLAELTGHHALDVDVSGGDRVADALRAFAAAVTGKGRDRIVVDGTLHPSVLVVLGDAPCTRPAETSLEGGETIRLMLPVTGG